MIELIVLVVILTVLYICLWCKEPVYYKFTPIEPEVLQSTRDTTDGFEEMDETVKTINLPLSMDEIYNLDIDQEFELSRTRRGAFCAGKRPYKIVVVHGSAD
jgi:hypothetical protein